MGDRVALLKRLYEAFNRKDLDVLLASAHPEIDWPDFVSGGRIKGREALREYWTHQFGLVDPDATPIEFRELPDGRIWVKLHYLIRAVGGGIWADEIRTNTVRFRDGLVDRMDWDEAP